MNAAYLYGHVISKAVQVTAPLALVPAAIDSARNNDGEFDPSPYAKYIVPFAFVAGTAAFINKGALQFDNAGFAERAARIGINTMLTEKNLWTTVGVVACVGHSLLRNRPDQVDDVGVTIMRASFNGAAIGMAFFFVASVIRSIAER